MSESSSNIAQKMELGVSAAKFLLGSAQKIIWHYYKLMSGAKAELDELMGEFKLMESFVETYQKQEKNGFSETWVRQIRDVVCEVEDIIASCATQVAAEENSNFFFKMFKVKKKIDLAEQVKAFRAGRMKSVFNANYVEFVKLLEANRSERPIEPSTKGKKDPRQDNVIPLKDETHKLIRDLTSDSQEQQVFAIVGMPGLGKTTLAWKVFRHADIDNKFPILIWVSVSQVFDKNNVLLTILEKLKEKNPTNKQLLAIEKTSTTSEALSGLVLKILAKGDFLIIFDDVWTIDVWKEIQKFLPLEINKQGRVLITTRHHDLVRFSTGREVKDLRVLGPNESWELLQLEVFGNLVDCPSQLEKSGTEIAKYCGGLPFAIVVIGALLYDIWRTAESLKVAKEKWEKVSRSVGSYLNNDNMDNSSSINNKEDKISLRYIISLSYNILSNELKECFLYLGMFTNTEIPVRKLTRLWIAEGFIHKRTESSFEETAQDYLKKLIDKNLLMVEKAKPDGSIKSCRVHDLIRDFCKNEAANSFREIKLSHEGNLEPEIDEIQDCRRICIHSSLVKFLQKKPKIQKARSFLSFSKDTFVWDDKKLKLPSITKTFNLLRVLDVHMAIKFPKFPYDLTQLVLLKYVTLSGDEFDVLPEDVYKLWNVQTLEVYTSSATLEIKANIWKMEHLRHFKTKASIVLSRKLLKGKEEDGENLRTLNRLSPESCTSQVFMRKAKNLKALGIRGDLGKLFLNDLDSNSSHRSCLDKLEHLEKLKLLNWSSRVQTKATQLGGVPPREWFPKKLKILVISGTNLQWKHMSTLGQIEYLEVLKLKDNAFVGDRWDAGDSGFSRLESLHISDTDLAVWTATGESFPTLEDLVLRNCKQLLGVPDHFKGLQLLHLDGVSRSVVAAADKRKLQANKTTKRATFKLVIVPRKDDILPI